MQSLALPSSSLWPLSASVPHLENGDGTRSHLRQYCRFMGHLVPEKCLAQSKHIISPSSPSERVQVKWLLSVRIKIKMDVMEKGLEPHGLSLYSGTSVFKHLR